MSRRTLPARSTCGVLRSSAPARRLPTLLLVVVTSALGLLLGGCLNSGSASAKPIPASYLALYRQWGHVCRHVDWAVLAGIGEVESDHGRYPGQGVTAGVNGSGAAGPMQFLPSTYATEQHRHPSLGTDMYSPANEVPAAAYLLCESGAADDLDQAIYSGYNHSWTYVDNVESVADAYRAMPTANLTVAPGPAKVAAGQ